MDRIPDLGDGAPMTEARDTPWTPEMAAAGMAEWDRQIKAGVRSWPTMLGAVFVAMAPHSELAAFLRRAIRDGIQPGDPEGVKLWETIAPGISP